MPPRKIVFLLDVDNTLLDNDAIQKDLAQIHDAIAQEYFHLHQRESALGVAV